MDAKDIDFPLLSFTVPIMGTAIEVYVDKIKLIENIKRIGIILLNICITKYYG